MAGELEVLLIDGKIPTIGEPFTIMTYGSRTGTFDTELLPAGYDHALHRRVAYIMFAYGLLFAFKQFKKNLGRYSSVPHINFVLLLYIQVVVGIITLVIMKIFHFVI